MNPDATDASFQIQLGPVRTGLIIYPSPWDWGVGAAVNRHERYAFAALGPFELFLDW